MYEESLSKRTQRSFVTANRLRTCYTIAFVMLHVCLASYDRLKAEAWRHVADVDKNVGIWQVTTHWLRVIILPKSGVEALWLSQYMLEGTLRAYSSGKVQTQRALSTLVGTERDCNLVLHHALFSLLSTVVSKTTHD